MSRKTTLALIVFAVLFVSVAAFTVFNYELLSDPPLENALRPADEGTGACACSPLITREGTETFQFVSYVPMPKEAGCTGRPLADDRHVVAL